MAAHVERTLTLDVIVDLGEGLTMLNHVEHGDLPGNCPQLEHDCSDVEEVCDHDRLSDLNLGEACRFEIGEQTVDRGCSTRRREWRNTEGFVQLDVVTCTYVLRQQPTTGYEHPGGFRGVELTMTVEHQIERAVRDRQGFVGSLDDVHAERLQPAPSNLDVRAMRFDRDAPWVGVAR